MEFRSVLAQGMLNAITKDIKIKDIPYTQELPRMQLSDVYHSLVDQLCESSNQPIRGTLRLGLASALELVRCKAVYESCKCDSVNPYFGAMILVTFVRISMRRYIGNKPPGHRGATTSCCALTVSCIERAGIQGLTVDKMIFWERVLCSQEWLNQAWYTSILMPDDNSVNPRNKIESQYRDMHQKDNIVALVKRVLRQELQGPRSPLQQLMQHGKKAITESMVTMMASADRAIVQACITGQIAREIRRRNSRIRTRIDEMKAQGDRIPGNYINCLTEHVTYSQSISPNM